MGRVGAPLCDLFAVSSDKHLRPYHPFQLRTQFRESRDPRNAPNGDPKGQPLAAQLLRRHAAPTHSPGHFPARTRTAPPQLDRLNLSHLNQLGRRCRVCRAEMLYSPANTRQLCATQPTCPPSPSASGPLENFAHEFF